MAEALALARIDPELREWLGAQEVFNRTVREALRQMPVPAGLRHRIIGHAPSPQLPWWRRFPAWAATAAAAAMLMLYFGFPGGFQSDAGDSFATFRSRMVRSVLRQYQMDLHTNSMPAIRQFLSTNQAPSDYVLPAALDRLPPLGGGLLRWRDAGVSMVCLDSGGRGTAILFVVDAGSMKDPPPGTPALEQVSKLMTASWTDRGRAYLLMIDNAAVDGSALREFL